MFCFRENTWYPVAVSFCESDLMLMLWHVQNRLLAAAAAAAVFLFLGDQKELWANDVYDRTLGQSLSCMSIAKSAVSRSQLNLSFFADCFRSAVFVLCVELQPPSCFMRFLLNPNETRLFFSFNTIPVYSRLYASSCGVFVKGKKEMREALCDFAFLTQVS